MSRLHKSIVGLILLLGVCVPGRSGETVLEEPLRQMRERAQRFYDAGDYDNGHRAMAELVDAIPGRVELSAELLGVMRRASMADRRMNRWTEYASERLVALHQAGVLDASNAEVAAAYDCLCVVRWDQGRLWESWDVLQQLLELDLDNPYVRLGPLRLLSQVNSTNTIPLMLSVLDKVDASRKDDRTREWLMVAERILSQPQDLEHIPILDPWRQGFSRAKFWYQSNQEMLDDLKSTLTRRLVQQPVQSWTNHPPAPAGEALTSLRNVQETRYQERVRTRTASQRAGNEPLASFRALPWSQGASRELLDQAQIDLQRGRIAAARRSFGDILGHALDPATRQAAQVGLWLSAASENQAGALDTLFAAIEPTAVFTWMGKNETAANIKARLLKGMPANDLSQRKLAELEPRQLRLPAAPGWPDDTLTIQHGAGLVDLQVRGNQVLASTRRWLACYDLADPSKPLWFVSDSVQASSPPPGEPQLPSSRRPALGVGRLWTRAGVASPPDQIRAMDIEDGRTLWKTIGAQQGPLVGDAANEFHIVCADPVIVGSCMYYYELVGEKARAGEGRWDVVCAASDDGSLIWRSTLANTAGERDADQLFRELQLPARQAGNSLTVADGAVFFGHAGLAARLDARDGLVEWVQICRRGMGVAPLRAGLVAAPGAAPLVTGGRVVCLARDGAALFATDRKTGRPHWEQVFVQPLELLGATKDLVVVRTTVNRLAGIDLATGTVRWIVPVPPGPVGRGTVLGDVVVIGSHEGLLALNAADGTVRERRPWPAGKMVWNYAVAGQALVLVTEETAAVAAGKPDTAPSPDGLPEKWGPLGLPVKPAWDLPCTQRTRVFVPPAGSALQGRIFVAGEGMLESIDLGTSGQSAWRRFTMGSVGQILFDGTTMVLCSGTDPNKPGVQAAMAIDGRTGDALWRLPVFNSAAGVTMSDGVFVMYDADADIRAYDTATGQPLWNRLVARNLNMNTRAWPTPPLARSGQVHLFGARLQPGWEAGVPYPRFDLRTGALLPLRWIARGEGTQISSVQSNSSTISGAAEAPLAILSAACILRNILSVWPFTM